MAFLHTQSCECLKSELLLFETPPTQTTIEGSHWIQYKPISSLTQDAPIEFVIPGNGEEYTDLAHTMLSVRVGLKLNIEEDKLSTAEKESIKSSGPVNLFMHSLFSQVDVTINGKAVSQPTNAYPYRAFIETLLNYGPAAKNSHLSTVLWSDDTAGKMDDLVNGNEGLVARRKLLNWKKKVDMIGHLHVDIFNQEKLLLNGCELRVRLVRSRDNFCLMDTTNHLQADIEEANLLVRRVKISPNVLLAHAKALSKTTAKYPLTRVEVKSVTLHSDIHCETLDNVLMGQLPNRVIIGFCKNKAFNGDRSLNPFNFEHFDINFLCLYVDGVQVPSRALKPDFTKTKMYVDAYHTLFTGTGVHFLNEGNKISRASYPDGYCLFAFDLTPDLSANASTHWNLIKHGSVRLEVRFAEPLAHTVNCVIYSEYYNLMEIDAARQIITDYAG